MESCGFGILLFTLNRAEKNMKEAIDGLGRELERLDRAGKRLEMVVERIKKGVANDNG